MTGKFLLEGTIFCLTGLHIGGNQDTSDIGSVDLLVVRDPLTREPYIPGSSLKGKLRSLLELYHFAQDPSFFNSNRMRVMRSGGVVIRHHECGEEGCRVCRIFGATQGKNEQGGVRENRPARLYVRDAHLTEDSRTRLKQMDTGYYLTEVKFENTLDRITCAANPRQIERAPRGTEFSFQMVYTLWNGSRTGEVGEDLEEILVGLGLLQDDYLGGHGSRGYGQIELKDLRLTRRSLACYRGEEEGETVGEGKTFRELAAAVREWMSSRREE